MKIYLLACLACLVLIYAVPGQCQEAIYPPDEGIDENEVRGEEIVDVDDDDEIDVGRMLATFLISPDDDEQGDDDDDDDNDVSDREGREANLSTDVYDPLMIEKYNKFVDAVLSRMSMMMRLKNDPMRIVLRKSGKVALQGDGRNKGRPNRNKDRNPENRNKDNKNKNKNNGRKNSNRRSGNRGNTARRRHPKDLEVFADDDDVVDDIDESSDDGMEDESLQDDIVEYKAQEAAENVDDLAPEEDEEDGEQDGDDVVDEDEELEQEETEVPRRKRAIETDVEDDGDYYDYELEDEEDDYALEGRDLDDMDYADDAELEYDDEYDDATYNEVESSDPRDARELEEQETSEVQTEENNEPNVTGRNRRRRRKQAAARRRRRRKGGKRRKGKCGSKCRRRRKAMRRRIRRRNKSKKKRRRGNRGKRSVTKRGRKPTAVLSGVSRLRRSGDVRITERKDSQNIAADIELGPFLLKAEKIFGGVNQEVRRSEALATNVRGEIVINVNQDGSATVRKLRILKPNSIQVSGNLRRKPSKSSDNFMQAYVSKSRSLIVSKMKAVAAQILDATKISDSQVEKMKRSAA